MRKLLLIFFLFYSFSAFAQVHSVKENLARIFIEIPDTFFSPLERQLPDSVQIDRSLRKSMIDTLEVIDQWDPVFHFTAFDTVYAYMRLISKVGEPEGMTSEIAYWDRTDGTRLVMMTINFGDMCTSEQPYRYFWIDNGTRLVPVNESEVFPPLSQTDFISPAFLKKHKKAARSVMPYMILHMPDANTITYEPAFDYLFDCGEYFEDDPWFGLDGGDILHREIILYWNGNQFAVKK
jgi:hypothetical protein